MGLIVRGVSATALFLCGQVKNVPLYRRQFFVLLAIAAVALAASLFMFPDETAQPLPQAGETAAIAVGDLPAAANIPAEKIVVYVVGAVVRPGVVEVPAGSRAEAAVLQAGGLRANADAGGVNLAQPLKDGQQITVPAADGGAAVSPAATNGKININTADENTLATLYGVGAVTAKRIVEWRNEHGAFTSIDELKDVRGIGEAKFARLKDHVTI